MTLVQLEYIIALDIYRNFSVAAEKSFVTQPTLSMQIQKLEKELGIQIFDRSRKPITVTDTGKEVIELAVNVINGIKAINNILDDHRKEIKGNLRVAIIPTLAPYLLPLFLQSFIKKYPEVNLKIIELTTEGILDHLKKNQIDAGLLVTPLESSNFVVHPLFNEEFIIYTSKATSLFMHDEILINQIDLNDLWLLEEGHCFRSQIINLCERQKKSKGKKMFQYEAGSIETLKKMVERNQGTTILPELATLDFKPSQLKLVKRFKSPVPVREVSLITNNNFVKRRLIEVFGDEIIAKVPLKLLEKKKQKIVSININ
jgi:LysR family hydrogen peroxide-inducible transcriptional activator